MNHSHASSKSPLQLLVLERRDDSRNIARYYLLSIKPTLFGEPCALREWRRIGSPGRRLSNPARDPSGRRRGPGSLARP